MLTVQKVCKINQLRKELFLKRVGEKVAGLTPLSSWSDIVVMSDLAVAAFRKIEDDVRCELCQSHMWPEDREMSRFLRSLYGYGPLIDKLFARKSDYQRSKPYHGCYSSNAEIYMIPRHTAVLYVFDIYIVSPMAAKIYAGDWLFVSSPMVGCVSFVEELPEEIASMF